MTELQHSTTEQNLPATETDLVFTGYETIDESAFIIPRLKIVQPTSKEGTPGTFQLNLTGDEYDELTVVCIKAERGRVMWDKDDRGAEKPLCRSYDFLVPDANIENPPSERCAEYKKVGNKRILKTICPKAQWINGERPPCDEVFNLLCLSLEEDLPFWISLSGASIIPVRRYLSGIALRRKKLWEFETTLSLEERKEPHKHYVIKFSRPKPISEEMKNHIIEAVANYKEESIQKTFEAEEAMEESDIKDAPDNEMPEWMKEEMEE